MNLRGRLSGIRTGAVLAATAALAVALFVGALILRTQLSNSVYSSVEDQALTRASGVAALVETGDFARVLESTDPSPGWVQVINDQGEVVASSANIKSMRTAFAPIKATARPVVGDYSGLPIDDGERLAVASVVARHGEIRYTVLAASPLDLADAADQKLRSTLIVVFPALLALAALVVSLVLRRALRPVEAIRNEVATISTSDLSRRVPVSAGDDEISRLATTMNDMLGRLQQSVEQQRRFVGDASHELRSPMASLRAQLEVSTVDNHDPAWAVTVNDMLTDHDRIERLIRDLLLLARFDSREPLALEPLDLGYVVRREMKRRPEVPHIERVVEADNALIVADDDSIARILRNLVDNAERHATSSVRVSVKQLTPHMVQLIVSNDGPDIPTAERERIFKRFTRLDDARASDVGGSGLGLAIVAELISAQNGTVAVDPNATGATFVVSFPALQTPTG